MTHNTIRNRSTIGIAFGFLLNHAKLCNFSLHPVFLSVAKIFETKAPKIVGRQMMTNAVVLVNGTKFNDLLWLCRISVVMPMSDNCCCYIAIRKSDIV